MVKVMRQILLTGITFMTLLLSSGTHAQSTKCSSILDHDDRMICNAVSSRHKTWCGFVKDSQKRAWCYVLLQGK